MLQHNIRGARSFRDFGRARIFFDREAYGNTVIVAKSLIAVPGDVEAAYSAMRNSLDKIRAPMMIDMRPIQALLSASRSCSEFAIVTSPINTR
ncbi:hypothetical protein [Bradyrhizobium cenepequi]